MNRWIEELARQLEAGEQVVVVTVAGVRGSAPRETGAKMLVTADASIGTIGGGQLEYECTRLAVRILAGEPLPRLRSFVLGPQLGQCCGGTVDVLFESFAGGLPEWLRDLRCRDASGRPALVVTGLRDPLKVVLPNESVVCGAETGLDPSLLELARSAIGRRSAQRRKDLLLEPITDGGFHVAVFGAGHVGSALVSTLADLDCEIRWVDSRPEVLRDPPRGVRTISTPHPARVVATMPSAGFYLVMTHSHLLDFEICDRVLRRGDAAYCGLIGSGTKRRRFEHRLLEQGLSAEALRVFACPIGLAGITGKKPAEIAISTAAELLRIQQQRVGSSRGRAAACAAVCSH